MGSDAASAEQVIQETRWRESTRPGRLELVNLDETTVGRVMLPAGWSWSKDVRPVVATSSADWWLIVVRITKVGGVSDAV